MKLDKSQRFTAYCIMLAEAETGEHFQWGICLLIERVFGLYCYTSFCMMPWKGIKNMKQYFPELYAARKENDDPYWFSDWKQRINFLKKCIIETHP